MLILSSVSLNDELTKKMKEEFPSYIYEKKISNIEDKVLENVKVYITYGGDITKDLLNKMKSLELIHVMQSGINDIPFEELSRRDIILTNSRGINAITIAEYTMSMMLNVVRRNFEFYEDQKKKRWNEKTTIDELAMKNLGILGMGTVGTELAKRAKAFDMVIYAMKNEYIPEIDNVDKVVSKKDSDLIFKECDFIVCLLPLTSSTFNFINENKINLMKKDAYLINVSRGEIIETNSLKKALYADEIGGVVLDVFDNEPLTKNSEEYSFKNTIITPHIAGDRFPKYKYRAFNILFHNLLVLKNKKEDFLNEIDKTRQY